MLIRYCIGCGCSDGNACRGGCAWELEAEAAPLGICTNCSSEIGADELADAEFDWKLENGESEADDVSEALLDLLLPGDPEYHETLRSGR